MKNTVIKFGSYAFVTASVLFLSGFLMGKNLDFDTMAIIGYASMIVSLLFVYFGIRYYRDKENNGRVSFGKALAIGLLISVFAAIGFGIIDYIYTTSINPNFAEDYLAYSIEKLNNQGLSVSEIETQKALLIEQTESMKDPTLLAFVMFVTVIIIGFIMSLISALILQRKN